MADPFSITASAIGIAAFAQQLAQSTLRIKQFCKDVKNAPVELEETLDEIGELGRRIARLGQEQARSPALSVDAETLDGSIYRCQRALNRMSVVARDMQAEVKRNRVLGALKATLKKQHLEDMIAKLDRSKSDLHFAYSMHADARGRDEMERLRRDINEGNERQARLLAQILEGYSESTDVEGQKGLERTTRSVLKRNARSKQTASRRNLLNVRFQLPTWLCQYACDFLFDRASGSWTTTLKIFRLIDDYSILRMCELGDVAGIQDLLEKRQLSVHDQFVDPYDPDVRDKSLCSVAIESQQTELARYLIQCGANPSWEIEFTCSGSGALYFSPLEPRGGKLERDPLLRVRSHAQLLQEYDEYDFSRATDIIDALAKEPSVWSSYERLAVLCGLTRIASMDMFWAFLGAGDTVRKLFLVEDPWYEHTLFHAIAALWSETAHSSLAGPRDAYEYSLDKFPVLLKLGVSSGANFQSISGWVVKLTPFLIFLRGLPENLSTNLVQQWVNSLADVGVNLQEYGDFEHRIFRYHRSMGCDGLTFHWSSNIIGFSYGPRISDWRVYYEPLGGHYAAQFWNIINHPELAMPGAWTMDLDWGREDYDWGREDYDWGREDYD